MTSVDLESVSIRHSMRRIMKMRCDTAGDTNFMDESPDYSSAIETEMVCRLKLIFIVCASFVVL